MSYESVVDGLHERFATVSGIELLLKYEPTSLQKLPAIYTLLDSYTREYEGHSQLVSVHYRILNRLCIRWQDNEKSELELMPFVNSIASAVDADPHLGGRLTATGGKAKITDATSGWFPVGDTVYRILDIYADVWERGEFGGGI